MFEPHMTRLELCKFRGFKVEVWKDMVCKPWLMSSNQLKSDTYFGLGLGLCQSIVISKLSTLQDRLRLRQIGQEQHSSSD